MRPPSREPGYAPREWQKRCHVYSIPGLGSSCLTMTYGARSTHSRGDTSSVGAVDAMFNSPGPQCDQSQQTLSTKVSQFRSVQKTLFRTGRSCVRQDSLQRSGIRPFPRLFGPFSGMSRDRLANQTTAFRRMSRSSLSCSLSRLRRRNSLRAEVVSPSPPCRSSRSACLTHLRIVCSVGANSRARDRALRPFLTSLTTSSLNSGG